MNPFCLGAALSLALAQAGAPPAPPPPAAVDAPAAPARPAAPYRELTLERALEALDAQSLTLAQSRARAAEASAVVREAAAGLLPNLSARGSYTRNSASAQFPRGPGELVVIQPLEQLSATGTLRVPLIVPSTWFDVARARGAARAADATAGAVRQQVRTGFAQAAYAAVAAEEAVAASERAALSAAELVRSAERRTATGTAAPLDVLRAKTELVRRQSDLAAARADLDRARLALGILLGREAPVRVAVPAVTPGAAPDPSATPEALAADALARRPELVAERARREAAEAGIRSAWARLAPQVAASGSAFASDQPDATGHKDGWRVLVELSWTLYDGGYRYGARRQAEAQAAGASAAEEAARLAVIQEVQDGLRDADLARERLRLAESQAQLAGDAAASVRRSFEAGVASSLDVIDANDRTYLADIGLAQARARLAQARLALGRALGRGP